MDLDFSLELRAAELWLDLSFDGGQNWDHVPHADWETSGGWDLDGVFEDVQSGLSAEWTSLGGFNEVFEVADGGLLSLGEDLLQAGWQEFFLEWENSVVDISIADAEHGEWRVVGVGITVDALLLRAAFDSEVVDDLAEVVVGFA